MKYLIGWFLGLFHATRERQARVDHAQDFQSTTALDLRKAVEEWRL